MYFCSPGLTAKSKSWNFIFLETWWCPNTTFQPQKKTSIKVLNKKNTGYFCLRGKYVAYFEVNWNSTPLDTMNLAVNFPHSFQWFLESLKCPPPRLLGQHHKNPFLRNRNVMFWWHCAQQRCQMFDSWICTECRKINMKSTERNTAWNGLVHCKTSEC